MKDSDRVTHRTVHRLLLALMLMMLCAGVAAFDAKPVYAAQTSKTAAKNIVVNLRPAGGRLIPSGSKTYVVRKAGGTYGELPKAFKLGYFFKGWWTGKYGIRVSANTKLVKNHHHYLYAQYQLRNYKITYELDGGTNNSKNPAQYTILQQVTLYAPMKTGYTFDGWYKSADYKKSSKITRIKKGSFGKLTLYAKFTKNESETDPDDYIFSGKNNIEKLYNYFQYLGYTKEASAAICGNLMWESGGGYQDIRLNAVEAGSGAGIGMVQWTDTSDAKRRTNFLRYCRSVGETWPNTNLKVQADFLVRELTGKEGKVWYFLSSQGYPAKYKAAHAAFKKMTDVTLATCVFCCNFERPLKKYAGLTTRVKYAKYVMAHY